ncbi:MAG: hypothetical protein AAGA48_08865 [Myxococcota bacterium]
MNEHPDAAELRTVIQPNLAVRELAFALVDAVDNRGAIEALLQAFAVMRPSRTSLLIELAEANGWEATAEALRQSNPVTQEPVGSWPGWTWLFRPATRLAWGLGLFGALVLSLIVWAASPLEGMSTAATAYLWNGLRLDGHTELHDDLMVRKLRLEDADPCAIRGWVLEEIRSLTERSARVVAAHINLDPTRNCAFPRRAPLPVDAASKTEVVLGSDQPQGDESTTSRRSPTIDVQSRSGQPRFGTTCYANRPWGIVELTGLVTKQAHLDAPFTTILPGFSLAAFLSTEEPTAIEAQTTPRGDELITPGGTRLPVFTLFERFRAADSCKAEPAGSTIWRLAFVPSSDAALHDPTRDVAETGSLEGKIVVIAEVSDALTHGRQNYERHLDALDALLESRLLRRPSMPTGLGALLLSGLGGLAIAMSVLRPWLKDGFAALGMAGIWVLGTGVLYLFAQRTVLGMFDGPLVAVLTFVSARLVLSWSIRK